MPPIIDIHIHIQPLHMFKPEALALMSKNPNLTRPPVVISGKKVLLGYDAEELKDLP